MKIIEHEQKQNRLKLLAMATTCLLAWAGANPVVAQSASPLVKFHLETTKDLGGRWRVVPLEGYQVRDGQIYLRANQAQGFYRLVVDEAPDADLDKDGVPNRVDNCPLTPNPDQADRNGNGIGDVCEGLEAAPGPERDPTDPYANIPPDVFKQRSLHPLVLARFPEFHFDPAAGPDALEPDFGRTGPGKTLGQTSDGDGGFGNHPSGLEGDEGSDTCTLDNYLVLQLASHVNAGSTVSAIELHLGGFTVYLLAPTGGFAPNQVLHYNFNNSSCPSCWNTMAPDDWDAVSLINESSDGIKIAQVEMVHSGMLVLDSSPKAWLDKHYQRRMDFSLETGMTRWAQILDTRVTALYYAAQDLGQTGCAKYVSGDHAWCSEFTSWAIRKNGLNTPTGSIGTSDMKSYFNSIGRGYWKAQVEKGDYLPQPGDYFSINSGGHSVLFVGWQSAIGETPRDGDKYLTIEGNTCNAVRMKTRDWSSVEFVGRAQ